MPSFQRLWRKRVCRLIVGLIAAYASLIALLIHHEADLVYVPFKPRMELTKYYPGYQLKTLNTEGPSITYWEHATTHVNAPILLYFHGNGGLQPWALSYFATQPFHIIAIEYPGYPGAAGSPSEMLIIAQAKALNTYFAKHYPKQPRILWGYSLGTGIAVQVAAALPPTAMVLEAPFTAVVDKAREMFPYLPIQYLMQNQYLSRNAIKNVHTPLFIMHGDADQVIPIAQGKALFGLANEPKTFKEYTGFDHFNLRKSSAYADAMAFIRSAISSR